MTQSFATKAAFRFGYGFGPESHDVRSVDGLMEQLRQADVGLAEFVGPDLAARHDIKARFQAERKRVKQDRSASRKGLKRVRRESSLVVQADMARMFQRAVFSEQSFRERLVFFWMDHFTVVPKTQSDQIVWGDYMDGAIRPNITGRFADLLIPAVTHPSMVSYLDQHLSVGPNSPLGKRKKKGLNENLAREILELHTMGVGGSYSQSDVREFAELLTGIVLGDEGTVFQAKRAEPGSETVLGETYGGRKAKFSDILEFLEDVAIHPDTARYISQKLVVHFVSDEPDPALIEHMAQVFVRTDGDLMSVYGAMLDHPAAWGPLGDKVKQPFDFMVSAMRSLQVPQSALADMNIRRTKRFLLTPLDTMGQPLRKAPGPNGWPEDAEAWITAQGLAARLQWALAMAQQFGADTDPRDHVEFSLRELAGETLRFAVGGAEKRIEGLTLVLASPEFNRR